MSPSHVASIAFLVLLAAVPLAITVIRVARSRLSPFQCLLYGIAYLLSKLLWRATWVNPLPLAEGQGAIIVCNHRSSVDPFFLQTATDRKLHWMVAREYCEHWALRWFLSACEVIPVRRGGIDIASTKAAIRMTAAGDIVGMLPEGRINTTDQLLLPARPGAALVALKTKAPVVPCYIEGSPFRDQVWSPMLMPAKVKVRFGPPVDLAEFYGREHEEGVLEQAMLRILRAIAALSPRPDFEPQLAGRKWKPE